MGLRGVMVLGVLALVAGGKTAMGDVSIEAMAGDGDDSVRVQEALDAVAEAGGGSVDLGAGWYRLRTPLTIPLGVALVGTWQAPHHSEGMKGTVLAGYCGKGDEDAEPLINLQPNSAIRGVTIFYPEQAVTGTVEEPEAVPFPWTIQGQGMHCSVIDVTLVNSYKGVDFGTQHGELHHIRNLFGNPLKVGVFIDQCTDIGRVENVHFNPHFWARAGTPGIPDWGVLMAYIQQNLTGFAIGRTDWEYMSDCFVIFPKIGFHFADFGHGGGNAVLTQSGADICEVAVRIEATQPHAGIAFSNSQFMTGIEIAPSNTGPVKFTGCGFWGFDPTAEHVIHEGDCTLFMTGCHFVNWAVGDPEAAAIRCGGGSLIVNGCDFMDAGDAQIAFEAGVKSATVFGNLFRGGQRIKQPEGWTQAQIGMNVTE